MPDEPAAEQADTRGKILEIASRLFSQHGYDNTSLSQVAREAKVSKALIFWHFDTKEKLFKSAVRKTLEPYFVSLDDLEGLDEPAQIRELVDDFYDFVTDNVYSVRFLLSLMLRDQKGPGEVLARINELYGMFRQAFADVIEHGRSKGTFAKSVDASLEASAIMATLAGVMVHQFMEDRHRDDSKRLLQHLKQTVLQRLGASN